MYYNDIMRIESVEAQNCRMLEIIKNEIHRTIQRSI